MSRPRGVTLAWFPRQPGRLGRLQSSSQGVGGELGAIKSLTQLGLSPLCTCQPVDSPDIRLGSVARPAAWAPTTRVVADVIRHQRR